jgi:AraC-like DNA-binding protein
METSDHLQYRSGSVWTDFPRRPAQDQRPDRSVPVAAAAMPRTRMRFVREEPANTFVCSTVAARFESIEPFGAVPNAYDRPSLPACGRRVGSPARKGLAAWQQVVVAAYIQKHITEGIRIRALARFVYLSSYSFCRAFKRSFGIPPHRYLVQQRIERAKALLASSEWSITEIGLALGFRQTSSFSAAFRHVTGLSPTEYRRTQQ